MGKKCTILCVLWFSDRLFDEPLRSSEEPLRSSEEEVRQIILEIENLINFNIEKIPREQLLQMKDELLSQPPMLGGALFGGASSQFRRPDIDYDQNIIPVAPSTSSPVDFGEEYYDEYAPPPPVWVQACFFDVCEERRRDLVESVIHNFYTVQLILNHCV